MIPYVSVKKYAKLKTSKQLLITIAHNLHIKVQLVIMWRVLLNLLLLFASELEFVDVNCIRVERSLVGVNIRLLLQSFLSP